MQVFLEMAATARVIWLCTCVRYWPGRGIHQRKMSDWLTQDHVTLPNSKWRQDLHHVERRLIAA